MALKFYDPEEIEPRDVEWDLMNFGSITKFFLLPNFPFSAAMKIDRR